MAENFDVVVIGAGPAGYVAAIRAAQLKQKVAIVDKQWLGGVCLNVGCIPSKSLLKNAEVAHTLRERGKDFGFSFDNLKLDFGVAFKRSRQVSDRLVKGVGFLMKKNSITVFMGDAHLTKPTIVTIKDTVGKTTELNAKNIIVATGATAAVPGASDDLRALAEADSVAVDPHKWLYAPLEAGCALVRDAEALRGAFSYHPPYYHFEERATNYVDYGPQNSRGFRALKVWLALRQAGANTARIVQWKGAFPPGYRATRDAARALQDIAELDILAEEKGVSVEFVKPGSGYERDCVLRLYHRGPPVPLSRNRTSTSTRISSLSTCRSSSCCSCSSVARVRCTVPWSAQCC